MDDKNKGFSLRQKKSKRIPISGPKPISGPISQTKPPTLNGSTRTNTTGRTDTANTADIVKRRYSTRFNQLPDFNTANAPPVPSLSQGYSKPSSHGQQQAGQGLKIPLDVNALKDPAFQTEKYSTNLLADASDQDLQDYQGTLRKLKNRASSDIQQNVYQNRSQFIKVSKEAEKLKGEMRTLRGLISELTSAVSQASISAGALEPTVTIDDDARSRARKQANRSSVANLEAMWSAQLHTLWKKIEGSQKFLPAIPGRHVVTEQQHWLELDAATWKTKRHAHIFLLNDHLMIAGRRKKRVDASTAADAKQSQSTRAVADRCWPLQDIDMVDLASNASGAGDKRGMSNAISIRCGQESFTYRSDKTTTADKMKLLQDFRRTADELRRTLRADMEEQSNKTRENMDYLTTRDPALSNKTELLRKISNAKDRPEIMIEVDGKHQNLRWVEGQIDELDSEVALQRFEEAVRRIEKLRKLAKGLKGNMIAQDLISTKVDERARKLAELTDILNLRLSATHAHLAPTQKHIAYLVRLSFDALARETYLSARKALINTRARSIIFEGDLRHHVFQLSFVYFSLMRNTVKVYQQCFPPLMSSACVKWCHERLQEFNDSLGRQLSSVTTGSPTYADSVARAKEHAGMMGEVGLDFKSLVQPAGVQRMEG
ncbi:uncharacterized protein KY384_007681 [Bacidia gigantensis]|uniref:uncharacterized protein n=1 Tax=Bacidia gigantensis TaxID=2732470 RepID=UPI001D038870|nr:uncharacterized protein KY384_007681 [Bacidia gigantensis]KAG8527529.1 hypothetical protein KY384_007681 [Bacidia gigantensis]